MTAKKSLVISIIIHFLLVVAVSSVAKFAPPQKNRFNEYLVVNFTIIPTPGRKNTVNDRKHQITITAPATTVAGLTPQKARQDPTPEQGVNPLLPAEAQENEQYSSRYAGENLLYIQRSIFQNLRYPEMARRRGWQGTAIVSFIVEKDGSVSNIRVRQTSGVGVLDKNAVETIVASAPFPQPLVPARLIVPITYSLI
ncbi:MAG: energy transducer TonB [Deltaproteobacteria bacterium]|nr:energy transducer TonB [Deltaproteobacteria bacterium]